MITKFTEASNAYKIDGYRGCGTEQDERKEFSRAKEELIEHLREDIETVKGMSLERFIEWKMVDFNPDKMKGHPCP